MINEMTKNQAISYPQPSNFSIVVLVKNRQQHLENLLQGIQNLVESPLEVVVVHMNEPIQPAPKFFQKPYVGVQLLDSTVSLPLAQARNYGASVAQSQQLIFLDVDCIPSPSLTKDYRKALTRYPDSIAMGNVYYLPQPLPETWQHSDLETWGQTHPARTYPKIGQFLPTPHYHLFWSLNFAINQSVWEKIGGFDQQFQGYGAEDTDFAFTAKTLNVPLIWVGGASAYHQYHAKYSPPLQHFQDIVKNATVFYRKWGWWPMEKWLQQFTEAGYIRWSATSASIVIIEPPSSEAVDSARQ